MGVVSHVTHFFKFWSPNHIFQIGEAGYFKFRLLIDTQGYYVSACMIYYPQQDVFSHVTSLNF